MTVAQVRALVPDKPAIDRFEATGDGVTAVFDLPYAPLVAGSTVVTLAGEPQLEGVEYTVDLDLGVLTFQTAPAAAAAIVVRYQHTLVSDGDIQTFLDLEPDVRFAAAQVLDTIAANQALILKVVKVMDLTTDGAKLAAELRERAMSLRKFSYREVAF
jgi:hypothetical protein